jgi:hypothetical protein
MKKLLAPLLLLLLLPLLVHASLNWPSSLTPTTVLKANLSWDDGSGTNVLDGGIADFNFTASSAGGWVTPMYFGGGYSTGVGAGSRSSTSTVLGINGNNYTFVTITNLSQNTSGTAAYLWHPRRELDGRLEMTSGLLNLYTFAGGAHTTSLASGPTNQKTLIMAGQNTTHKFICMSNNGTPLRCQVDAYTGNAAGVGAFAHTIGETYTGGNNWNNWIDETGIFVRALSMAEMKELNATVFPTLTPIRWGSNQSNVSGRYFNNPVFSLTLNATNQSIYCLVGNYTINDSRFIINRTLGNISLAGPNTSMEGNHTVTVFVNDTCGNTINQTFNIYVYSDAKLNWTTNLTLPGWPNTAALTFGVTYSDKYGIFGQGANFSGAGQIRFPDTTYNINTSAKTFMAWVSPRTAASQEIFGHNSTTTNRFIIWESDGDIILEGDTNNNQCVARIITPNSTTPHHITVVVDRGICYFFRDSEFVTAADNTVANNITLNVIGMAGTGTYQYANAFIDEARIFDGNFTPAMIRAEMDSSVPIHSNLLLLTYNMEPSWTHNHNSSAGTVLLALNTSTACVLQPEGYSTNASSSLMNKTFPTNDGQINSFNALVNATSDGFYVYSNRSHGWIEFNHTLDIASSSFAFCLNVTIEGTGWNISQDSQVVGYYPGSSPTTVLRWNRNEKRFNWETRNSTQSSNGATATNSALFGEPHTVCAGVDRTSNRQLLWLDGTLIDNRSIVLGPGSGNNTWLLGHGNTLGTTTATPCNCTYRKYVMWSEIITTDEALAESTNAGLQKNDNVVVYFSFDEYNGSTLYSNPVDYEGSSYFDNRTGIFSINASILNSGIHDVEFYALSNCSDNITQTIRFNITNTDPALSCTNNTFRHYRNVSVCSISDSDGDALTLTTNSSGNLTLNSNTLNYTYQGTTNAVGVRTWQVNVTDGAANVTTQLRLNITDYSVYLVSLCDSIPRLRIAPNITTLNTSASLVNHSNLANGTRSCTFVINTTGEEESVMVYVKGNYTNSTYVLQFGDLNLTPTAVLLATLAPNTTNKYNVTGYWVNAPFPLATFPIRLSINLTV